MKANFTVFLLALFCCGFAQADVWSWVDANGDTHFVDTMKSIYTWVDQYGDVHYSDTPDNEDAVAVQLVWHSSGTLDDVENDGEESGSAVPGETAEEKATREQAEAYYCQRAKEIYESYLNAPRMYRTNEDGEREYLDGADAAKTIAETRERKEELCKGM